MDGVASSCEGDSWLLPSGECSLFGCSAGYFRSSSAKECSQCDAACSECSGPSSSECLACPSSHYLNKLNGQAGDCHAKTTEPTPPGFELFVFHTAVFSADTDGSLARPFLDLRDALRRADELAARFTAASVTIYLSSADWHSLPVDPLTYVPSQVSATRDYALSIR